jgi:CRP-like cAMP-binding protein
MARNMASHPTAGDLQIITRIAVFQGLKPETVEQIIAPATAVVLKPHETLFWQGDPATAFFIVIDGWVKLYRITVAGEETVIHVLTRGDSFAEAVAFTGFGKLRRLAADERHDPGSLPRCAIIVRRAHAARSKFIFATPAPGSGRSRRARSP